MGGSIVGRQEGIEGLWIIKLLMGRKRLYTATTPNG
jgi:hypothetical protein